MKRLSLILLLIFFYSCHPDEIEETEDSLFDLKEVAICQPKNCEPENINYKVSNVNQFLNAISNAKPGNTIYVKDNSYLDFSNSQLPIVIDKSLNIVSGRNSDNTNGAILYSKTPGKILLKIEADNVYLKGLKIYGSDTIVNLEPYFPQPTIGIQIAYRDSLIIDNCEISGWSYAGISIFNSNSNIIKNSYIHHNKRKGLGYGISLHNNVNFPTDAIVYCNYFENNRHDISASGNEGQSYEAAYNIVGITSEGNHSFDMHGKNGDTEEIAGTKILIHHNKFLSEIGYAIKIRGIPQKRAEIYANEFAHLSYNQAIQQTLLKKPIFNNKFEKIYFYNNIYGLAQDRKQPKLVQKANILTK